MDCFVASLLAMTTMEQTQERPGLAARPFRLAGVLWI
jgi:hypothetical protein